MLRECRKPVAVLTSQWDWLSKGIDAGVSSPFTVRLAAIAGNAEAENVGASRNGHQSLYKVQTDYSLNMAEDLLIRVRRNLTKIEKDVQKRTERILQETPFRGRSKTDDYNNVLDEINFMEAGIEWVRWAHGDILRYIEKYPSKKQEGVKLIHELNAVHGALNAQYPRYRALLERIRRQPEY